MMQEKFMDENSKWIKFQGSKRFLAYRSRT